MDPLLDAVTFAQKKLDDAKAAYMASKPNAALVPQPVQPPLTLTPGIKPGYKTTEAWISGAMVILGYVATLAQTPDAKTKIAALGAAAVSAIGYAISRAIVKFNQN